eukprot:Pgem_evm2s2002
MLTERSCYTAATFADGRISIFSGVDDKYLNTAIFYNPQNNSWASLASMIKVSYYCARATLADGRIDVFGGRDNNKIKLNTAILKTILGHQLSCYTAATFADGRISIFSGVDDKYLNTAIVYNPQDNFWTSLASMPTVSYYCARGMLADGRIDVFRGRDYNKNKF